MTRVYASKELEWVGRWLVVRGAGKKSPQIEIVPDEKYPGMWRVRKLDGTLTDMVNRTRARDAARAILLYALNGNDKGAVAT